MDLKILWNSFINAGAISEPGPIVMGERFGDSPSSLEAYAIYKVVYSFLQVTSDRQLDFDQWPEIATKHGCLDSVELQMSSSFKKLLTIMPELAFFIKNINIPSESQVKAIASQMPDGINFGSISEAKRQLNLLHSSTWTRDRTNSEKQGGVSILGAISEKLLEVSFAELVDNTELFKSTNNDIKTYGDFVLMTLPNNLWFSVKSGYSRERLLASGYSNDVVGVGFFQDAAEFTSLPKIRNFKKVGFLAIYLPDSPVNSDQLTNNTNTYELVQRAYNEQDILLPSNINGKPFFRKLSSLGDDITSLKEFPIKTRTTINF